MCLQTLYSLTTVSFKNKSQQLYLKLSIDNREEFSPDMCGVCHASQGLSARDGELGVLGIGDQH